MSVSLGASVSFPDSENPNFVVESIPEGYKFTFLDENKKPPSFSINAAIVESLNAATGYKGEDADAIEAFRKYGKEKWPERFNTEPHPL